MENQVPEKVKTERSEIIRQLAEKNKRKYRSSLLGETQRVLTERTGEDHARGYGELFVPVRINGKELARNNFYNVDITGIEEGEDPSLLATVV